MKYWLVKSEPDEFSLWDLKAKGMPEIWDGIRNYQARNNLNDMCLGDLVIFYHSACKVPAAVGVAKVVKTAFPDPSQYDKSSKYFDKKSTLDKPKWMSVELQFEHEFKVEVPLKKIKSIDALSNLQLLKNGRLSVSALSEREFNCIYQLGQG